MSLTATYCFSLRNALPFNQNEILEILDQEPNLQIGMRQWFPPKMDYKSAILYLILLENLDKICRTNGPAPTVAVDTLLLPLVYV
jgi:hypothetical protein